MSQNRIHPMTLYRCYNCDLIESQVWYLIYNTSLRRWLHKTNRDMNQFDKNTMGAESDLAKDYLKINDCTALIH